MLNQKGNPVPTASAFLGNRIFIRRLDIEDGSIVVKLDTTGSEESTCCPTDSKRQTYIKDGDALVITEAVDLPDPEVSAHMNVPEKRITFAPGAISATATGRIGFSSIHIYTVHAIAAQVMTVTLNLPNNNVLLSIHGQDSIVTASILSELTTRPGTLPVTQDYAISTVAIGEHTTYTLDVTVVGQPEAPTEVTTTPAISGPLPTSLPPEGTTNNVLFFTSMMDQLHLPGLHKF